MAPVISHPSSPMTQEEFIRHLQPQQEPLRRFLLTLCCGDRFTADDIAQDAMLKAWMGFDRFKGEARFSTWLFKIGYNCWLNHRYQSKTSPLPDEDPISDSAADETFRYQELYQAISELNPNERAAILLFYMEEKNIKEIASIMNTKTGTVKSLLSRGRDKLRNKVDSE